MLLIVLVLIIITFNIYIGMMMGKIIEYPRSLDNFCGMTYAIVDTAMAAFSMILFLRPIWSNGFGGTVSSHFDRTTWKMYAVASILQLVAAVLFNMMLLSGKILGMNQVPMTVHVTFDYINRIIQQVDSLLLMICIYFGFARKKTVCIIYNCSTEDRINIFVE